MQTEKAGLYSQQLCSASICLGRYILSWVLYGGRPRHIYHVATRSDLHIIDAEFKPLWGDRACQMWGTISLQDLCLMYHLQHISITPLKLYLKEKKKSTPGIEVSRIGKCTP